jgi:DNA recombination protein RmuC
MRDQAHAIHAEVGKLLNDVRLLAERTAKLEGHFRQAQDDVGQIATSAEKVTRRAARIDAMEFSEEADKVETQPGLRLATGGE